MQALGEVNENFGNFLQLSREDFESCQSSITVRQQ